MKKVLALLLVIALTAAISVGITLAYLTDRDSETNVFTMGNVDIELHENFEQGVTIYPGVQVTKEVTIENTGDNDAWVWYTITYPKSIDLTGSGKTILWTGFTTENHDNAGYAGANDGEAEWLIEYAGAPYLRYFTAEDGTEMVEFTILYQQPLAGGMTTPVSLEKVYLDKHIDKNENGDLIYVDKGNVENIDWNVNEDGNPVIYVNAYAIQTESFATVQEAFAAYTGQWNGLNGTYDAVTNKDSDSGSFAEDVNDPSKEGTLVIDLTEDVTYDVSAWDSNNMGSEKLNMIVINGNGHTLTFNHRNSDWNNIGTNGAKLVINNAHITNSGRNDGPWNRHDLTFNCQVELNNVTSDKAIALQHDSTLRNVTITESGAVYGLWIVANEITVDIDGLNILSERGIKIADEYVDAPGKVTLNLVNAKFATTKKAAVLVTSTAGAAINLTNVDISGCAADTTNAVWVDEDRAQYADLVTVTGGTVCQE